MFVSFLTGIRKFLFRSPKPLPPYDPQDLIEENKLLDFINQERIRNGLLPLEELTERRRSRETGLDQGLLRTSAPLRIVEPRTRWARQPAV